jgi:Phage derived protein Gp49-like (DUF891)
MKEVGAGVREIRIHVLGEWRVLYVAKFAEFVYVLHAFQKKTQNTRREDIELVRARYRQIEVRLNLRLPSASVSPNPAYPISCAANGISSALKCSSPLKRGWDVKCVSNLQPDVKRECGSAAC